MPCRGGLWKNIKPGKERQYTQVVPLPNLTLCCSRKYDKNKEPLRPIMKEDLGQGGSFFFKIIFVINTSFYFVKGP